MLCYIILHNLIVYYNSEGFESQRYCSSWPQPAPHMFKAPRSLAHSSSLSFWKVTAAESLYCIWRYTIKYGVLTRPQGTGSLGKSTVARAVLAATWQSIKLPPPIMPLPIWFPPDFLSHLARARGWPRGTTSATVPEFVLNPGAWGSIALVSVRYLSSVLFISCRFLLFD